MLVFLASGCCFCCLFLLFFFAASVGASVLSFPHFAMMLFLLLVVAAGVGASFSFAYPLFPAYALFRTHSPGLLRVKAESRRMGEENLAHVMPPRASHKTAAASSSSGRFSAR
jgi:hypothetical protein